MNFSHLFSKVCLLLITNIAIQACIINPVRSQTEKTFLWAVESDNNTVYLLGSVHFLRAKDYPLPQPIQDAFEDAEHLIFEIDLAEANNPESLSITLDKAAPDSPDELLQTALGSETYDLARKTAAEVGVPIEVFNQFEPWFFSVSLVSLKLLQLEFNPSYGVDFYLFNAARDAGKNISALETFSEQLSFFDNLSVPLQREFFRQTILDLELLESSFNLMIDSWKSGDVETFEKLILEGFEAFPELQRVFLSQRNQNWLAEIEPLVNQAEDYLVVVGAAHLVGGDGLIRLMQQRGYVVRQLGR
ncbi:MAG: TraB/GumN family protein [Xenococcaceae cyanobacterium]